MKKISLVTITYNASSVLAPTLESVLAQTYPAIEHIIVDGASTDNTVAMAKDYLERSLIAGNNHEVRLLVEPDNGIYDAMNKGLQMATGQYVCFLNAGDALHSADTIEEIVKQARLNDIKSEKELPAVLYGNTDIVDAERNFVSHRRLQPPETLSWRSFKNGMLVCHQAFYARTDLAKHSPYNTSYRYSADFDWCIRIMKKAQEEGADMINCGIVVADYLKEGETTRHHKASLIERLHIMAHHYGRLTAFFMHLWFVVRAVCKR